MEKRSVIVIGSEHHNSLGVVRSLGFMISPKYIYFINLSGESNFVCKSRFLKKENIYTIPFANLTDILLSISKLLTIKPVVICCADKIIHEIDCKYEELSKYCILPNANGIGGRIAYYLNKDKQIELAIKKKINVPKVIHKKANECVDNEIPIPCIIKNINSLAQGGGKSDIQIFEDKHSAYAYIRKNNDKDLIIQEYIIKQMEFQLIGCSLDTEIIIPGYTRIIRQPKNTNTGYLSFNPIQDKVISKELLNSVYRYIRKIGYKGLFSVEFIRDTHGVDYFLEINLRNDGNTYCVYAAGINLPYLWYKYSTGGDMEITCNVDAKKRIFLMPEFNDIANVRTIGWCNWLKDFFGADAHTILCTRDIKPFVYMLCRTVKKKMKYFLSNK